MTAETEARMVGRAQGAAAIVVLVVLAQFWPGWQLDSAADKEIAAAYNAGYTLAQAPVCASLFMAQPDAEGKLAELREANGAYAQMKHIPEAFRTLPGETRVNDALGRECLKFIVTPDQTSAQM
ncbi:hypothetical protein C4556_03445 [Candidatus Parcubacteria bacterium]|nr:MAG: hypothetical protein C4556_03445 [Candidatus Parcubacteria bacterium]